MKELITVYLILTVITIVGCTTTKKVSYPSNPHSQLGQIPSGQELRVEMTNGTKVKVDSVLVEGDSLFLFVEAASTLPRFVHRNEVASVAIRRVDAGRTLFLVGLFVAVTAAISLTVEEEDLVDVCVPIAPCPE